MRLNTAAYLGATAFGLLFLLLILALADADSLGPIERLYDFPHGDRVGHFVLYGGLALVATMAALSLATWSRSTAALVAGGVVVGLAAVEELSQLWFSSRSADWWDFVASVAGATGGTLAATVLAGSRRSSSPRADPEMGPTNGPTLS